MRYPVRLDVCVACLVHLVPSEHFSLWQGTNDTKGVIGCFGDGSQDGEPVQDGEMHAQIRAPGRIWLSLLLVQYEMRSCSVACMDGSFECMTHGPLYHGCIAPSCIAREVGIEKTEPCVKEGWR
jgi:hypothetical protein